MASTTITKRGDVWQYRIQYVLNGERKSVSKSGFKTKRDAKDAAILKEAELNNGVDVLAGNVLLADYMKTWKELYKDNTIATTTMKRYDTIISYIEEHFNVPIKDITLDKYQLFLNGIAQHRARGTVKKYHETIKAALTHAVRSQVLMRNPVDGAVLKGDKSREKDKDDKFLSLEQFKQLESVLMDGIKPEYTSRYVILFSMYTGARLGECLGMTWNCVNFTKGTIKIEKGFDYKITNNFTDTKTTGSKRTISVPRVLLKLLSTLPRTGDAIFPRISNNAVNKTLKKSLEKIGIYDNITFHALRHTHASILLSQGVQLLTVSKRLGHADPSITLKTYAHVISELESKDSKKINSIFD